MKNVELEELVALEKLQQNIVLIKARALDNIGRALTLQSLQTTDLSVYVAQQLTDCQTLIKKMREAHGRAFSDG